MKSILCLIFISFALVSFGQSTPGTVSFTVTTVDNNKKFSPDHVIAIWVEDGAGNYVKTLKVQAARRKQYLFTWNSKSKGNAVDAITGPTISDHKTQTVTWNCKDTTGTIVKDGDYQIVTEFTSEHKQGPLQKVSFTKGTKAIKLTPEKQPLFTDMTLEFVPEKATGKTK